VGINECAFVWVINIILFFSKSKFYLKHSDARPQIQAFNSEVVDTIQDSAETKSEEDLEPYYKKRK
jgi:hypothetical protein